MDFYLITLQNEINAGNRKNVRKLITEIKAQIHTLNSEQSVKFFDLLEQCEG